MFGCKNNLFDIERSLIWWFQLANAKIIDAIIINSLPLLVF
jgi:hypothetical protein